MKDSSAPQSPDPSVSIPLQGAENRRTFDYQLGQMRTNTSGPTGSSTWTKTPTFDQAGYDAALAKYNPGSQGTWVPETQVNTGGGEGGNWVTQPGHWEGATGPTGTMPNKEDFTTYNWTQTNTLSPEQQALYESNTGNQQKRLDLASGMLDKLDLGAGLGDTNLSGVDPGMLGNVLTGLASGPGMEQNLADTIYRQQTRYLDPQMEQQRSRLMAELADSGFTPGTPGYDQAMQNFMDTSNRSYGAARDSAIAQGYSQGNTQVNQQQALAQLLSGLQNQGFQQAVTRHNIPLSDLASLTSGAAPQMNFGGGGTSSTPNLGSTDIMGALNQQYQGQLGQYNANVSSNNATTGAIAGLLGSTASQWGPWLAGLFSDRRFKDVISRDGETPAGVPVYLWRYKGGKALFRGVMAQDLQILQPEAVISNPDGTLSVDYSKVQ